ncbi:hypothetical protein GQ42DRAFT_163147 [Ramicandelaber brevisporus]|nr:hypothetical protein GQ42DRAFT_163147 [Ramicandelaber brevisporus]
MAAEDVAAIRAEFGELRVGFESMDHGEMDITHGVLTLNGQSLTNDPGQPRWTGDEDDPNFVEDLDETRRLTGFSYPYYGEAGWD